MEIHSGGLPVPPDALLERAAANSGALQNAAGTTSAMEISYCVRECNALDDGLRRAL